MIRHDIENSGYIDLLTSGLVITGGTTNLDGMVNVAEKVFGLPVRRGVPTGIGGLTDVVDSPQYATAVGLLLFGHRDRKSGSRSPLKGRHLFNSITDRMKGWIEDFF